MYVNICILYLVLLVNLHASPENQHCCVEGFSMTYMQLFISEFSSGDRSTQKIHTEPIAYGH